jgi:hypothetical protein
MPPKAKLNVHNFPRPPLLERTPRHLVVKWNNTVIADTKDAYWVLQTWGSSSRISGFSPRRRLKASSKMLLNFRFPGAFTKHKDHWGSVAQT